VDLIENKQTIDDAIDRAQAAEQKILLTANQDLSKLIDQIDAAAQARVSQAIEAIGPAIAEIQALRLELIQWRGLVTKLFSATAK
jgi:hypothetical protein